jgi:hypothetical protein
MLPISDPRFGRREFLRIGGFALGGLGLSEIATWGAPNGAVKDKAVVLLFLHGGPSQIETFDPKMSAPVEVRSATGEVAARTPGITFGGTFPRLASLSDRLTVVRSFVTGDGNHDIKPVVGKDTFGANLGSHYAHVAGLNHPLTGLPRNAILFPRAVDPTTQTEQRGFGDFRATSALSPAYAPFVPSGDGVFQSDMKLRLPLDRLDDRRLLLTQLDQTNASLDLDQQASIDGSRAQALRVLLGSAAKAFDLSQETAKTMARYDTAPLVRPENINKKWNNYHHYVDNAKALGKLMLLARRLVERGVGFVTVTTNFVWDMHADVNNAPVGEGMRYMGLPLDYAVSAFLEDLAARGLSEKVLLVCCGEMGRTPRINQKGGRDHWGNLAPLLLAGGGLRMGQVIGRSDRQAGSPSSEPVTIRHLVSTILGTLLDTSKLRLQANLSRPLSQMIGWNPIPGV